MSGTLRFISTPIGNLEDVTLRALRVLKESPVIACEDTRVTRVLLDAHGISGKTFVSVHQHSAERALEDVLTRVESGEDVAYASDAGTPGVNDPGGKLAERAYGRGIKIEVIPGPSALTAAIAACGFPMEHFAYIGFIPQKKHRASTLKAAMEREEATVFFESTHRILKTLGELAAIDPVRRIYVGRELTKKFETHYRGPVNEVLASLTTGSSKGEFTVIVSPA